jgi:predicted nucleotide-binding protein
VLFRLFGPSRSDFLSRSVPEIALRPFAVSVMAKIDPSSTIFVVHGRDIDSRDQLELVLRRLGLAPFVLQVTGGGGDTLIEALERMIGKSAQSAFGIVLVTPDDMGRLKTEKPEEAKPRARQNADNGNGDAARIVNP